VLRLEIWRHLLRAPYGYPHSSPERSTIYVPATYPPPWIERSRALYESAPAHLQQQLGTDNSSLKKEIIQFYDLVTVHELGHLFIHTLELALGTHWLMELVSNLFATAFFMESRSDLAGPWFTWAELQASQEVPVRTLAQYEERYTGLSFSNASYYQGRFNLLARQLWEEQGYGIRDSLIEQFSLKEAAILERFRVVAPGFTWRG
jgi:hypothetical protein